MDKTLIRGSVYVLGDNVDTDQIIPAQYLNLVPTIPEELRKLGSHALSGLPEEMPPFVKPGSETSEHTIIVAGRNFGCGSSREHAPVCLGAAGIRVVVAHSYARIFFRNTVATGSLYPVESRDSLSEHFQTGDHAEIDLGKGTIRNLRTGTAHPLKAVGAVGPVIAAGGIFGYARAQGMIKQGHAGGKKAG